MATHRSTSTSYCSVMRAQDAVHMDLQCLQSLSFKHLSILLLYIHQPQRNILPGNKNPGHQEIKSLDCCLARQSCLTVQAEYMFFAVRSFKPLQSSLNITHYFIETVQNRTCKIKGMKNGLETMVGLNTKCKRDRQTFCNDAP